MLGIIERLLMRGPTLETILNGEEIERMHENASVIFFPYFTLAKFNLNLITSFDLLQRCWQEPIL
jgi:hypothetical protein